MPVPSALIDLINTQHAASWLQGTCQSQCQRDQWCSDSDAMVNLDGNVRREPVVHFHIHDVSWFGHVLLVGLKSEYIIWHNAINPFNACRPSFPFSMAKPFASGQISILHGLLVNHDIQNWTSSWKLFDCFSILWGRFASFKQWLVYVGVITTRLCSRINLDSCHCYVQFRLNNPNNPSSVNGIHLDVKKSCVCVCTDLSRNCSRICYDALMWRPQPSRWCKSCRSTGSVGWSWSTSNRKLKLYIFNCILPNYSRMILYRFNMIPRPSHHDAWLCHVRCTFPNTLNCRMLGLSHHSGKVMRDALQIHPMWILKFCTEWFSTFFKVGRHTIHQGINQDNVYHIVLPCKICLVVANCSRSEFSTWRCRVTVGWPWSDSLVAFDSRLVVARQHPGPNKKWAWVHHKPMEVAPTTCSF